MSQSENPYAPPRAAEPAARASAFLPVSAGTRLLHLVLDTVLNYALLLLFAFIAGAVRASLGYEEIDPEASTAFMVLPLCYHLIFESLLGRTPAKFITGTHVVTVTGQRPSFGQILARSAVRFVPFEPFSFLRDGVGWHDSWSGTRVVKLNPTPVQP